MSSQQVQEFFEAHWTVRKYKAQPMPKEHLEIILTAAQRAPTDATAQMASFIRLTDPELRKKIAEVTHNPHFATASESFLICADVHRLAQILKVHGHQMADIPSVAVHFGIGDAVLAGQNMMIAAEMLGYMGCWIGGVLTALEEIAKLTRMPPGVFPFAGLTIGVPDETPQRRPRIPVNMMVHENQYKVPSEEEVSQAAKVMSSITARGDWPQTLARYFAKGGTMETREPILKRFLQKSFHSLVTPPETANDKN